MEEFSKDSQLLLKEHVVVPGGITVQDGIYKELSKETDDEELDSLTKNCFRILCCSGAILLQHQLEDQLPGEKFYSPSVEIFAETKTTPKHSIICECDFAHLDRKLKESPQISSVALSGIMCFINNKVTTISGKFVTWGTTQVHWTRSIWKRDTFKSIGKWKRK